MKRSMFNVIIIVFAVTIAFFLGMNFSGSAESIARAGSESDNSAELLQRIEILESAVQQDDANSAELTSEEYLQSMNESLLKIAENSDKLEVIATSLELVLEKLAVIEEELAWQRMEEQEEGQ